MPDPRAHIPAAYNLASGQCFDSFLSNEATTFENSDDKQIMNLPENLSGSHNDSYNNGIISDLIKTIDSTREAQKAQLVDMQKTMHTITTSAPNYYFPICYLTTAVGMKVGMILDKSSWGILQLGRISNFVFYILIMLAATIILPRGKLVLVAIGSFPLCVFCASSLMTDAFLIALCALYVSIALYFIVNKKEMRTKHVVGVAILTILILFVKLPFGILALLYISMPKNIWKTKSKLIACIITLLLFAIIYIPWSKNYQLVAIYPNVSYDDQLSYFLHHPAFVMFNCFVNGFVFLFLTMPIDYTYMFLFTAVLFALIIFHYRPKMNICSAMSLIAVIVIIITTYLFLFLTWNNCQSITPRFLEGFQERYLIPLLPLLLVLCQEHDETARRLH